MFVIEDEAKKKWCPFARTYREADGGALVTVNREYLGAPDKGARCLGAECMAWRRPDGAFEAKSGRCGMVPP